MTKKEEGSMTKCASPYTIIDGFCIYSDINRQIIPFTTNSADKDQMKVCIQNKDSNGQNKELCSKPLYVRSVDGINYNYNDKKKQNRDFMYYGMYLNTIDTQIDSKTSGYQPVLSIGKRTYMS